MKYRVVVTLPYWVLSGVNFFSANLVRGLQSQGVSAEILLTEQDTNLVTIPDAPAPLPDDIPFSRLPVGRQDTWGAHWRALIAYLEDCAPCIYIPAYDWRHSIVSPKLSRRVCIVGALRSDDPMHYDHLMRLGKYWNAIVAVSSTVARHAAALAPDLASRITAIPNGFDIPSSAPERPQSDAAPLQMIYHGVLNQHQKRILDLPAIVEALMKRQVPAELTIVGDGPTRGQLLDRARPLMDCGAIRYLDMVPHARIPEHLRQSDVYLLPSAFEGMPNALLEAMGMGCVPIVTDIPSGIPELIRDGVSGFRVPVGDIGSFADRIELLRQNPVLRREMSLNAYRTIAEGGYRLQDMVDRYLALFERVLWEAERGVYQRPRGPLLAPPESVAGVQILPGNYAREIRETEWSLSWRRRFPARTNRVLDRAVRKLQRVRSDDGPP